MLCSLSGIGSNGHVYIVHLLLRNLQILIYFFSVDNKYQENILHQKSEFEKNMYIFSTLIVTQITHVTVIPSFTEVFVL